HTRFSRDWSSDVCSSDLILWKFPEVGKSLVAPPCVSSILTDLPRAYCEPATRLFSIQLIYANLNAGGEAMKVRILKPGILSSVQDLGRNFYGAQGIPSAGAMD